MHSYLLSVIRYLVRHREMDAAIVLYSCLKPESNNSFSGFQLPGELNFSPLLVSSRKAEIPAEVAYKTLGKTYICKLRRNNRSILYFGLYCETVIFAFTGNQSLLVITQRDYFCQKHIEL